MQVDRFFWPDLSESGSARSAINNLSISFSPFRGWMPVLTLYVDAFVEGMSTQTDSAPSCRRAGSILTLFLVAADRRPRSHSRAKSIRGDRIDI